MRKYVIMGVQGSGKGTQAKMLAEDLDLVHISVGDIFRWNVQNHTKMGAQVRRIMASGELVGDDLAESVVRDRLTQHDWNYGFIIDGFPRNRRQAEFFLESYDIDGVIVLDLPDSEVRRRVLNRRLCGNCGMDYNLIANSPAVPGQCDMCGGELVTREDDTEEALAVRLREYHQQNRVRPRDFPAQGVRLRRGRAARARDRPAADQEVPRPATVQARNEPGAPKLREIAVFGGTAHPALAAEICADLAGGGGGGLPGGRCLEVQLQSNCRDRDVFLIRVGAWRSAAAVPARVTGPEGLSERAACGLR